MLPHSLPPSISQIDAHIVPSCQNIQKQGARLTRQFVRLHWEREPQFALNPIPRPPWPADLIHDRIQLLPAHADPVPIIKPCCTVSAPNTYRFRTIDPPPG